MGVTFPSAKRAFDIHAVVRRIRQEVKQFADAAMFDLAEQGFATAFHQLAACIISVRTRDEVSLPAALRLFKTAPTAKDVSRLGVDKIAQLIRPASFNSIRLVITPTSGGLRPAFLTLLSAGISYCAPKLDWCESGRLLACSLEDRN